MRPGFKARDSGPQVHAFINSYLLSSWNSGAGRLRARPPGTPQCCTHTCSVPVSVPMLASSLTLSSGSSLIHQKWKGHVSAQFCNLHRPHCNSENVTKINSCVKWKPDVNSWGTKRTSWHDTVMEIQLNSFKRTSHQGPEHQSGFTEAQTCPMWVHPTWGGCATLPKKGKEGALERARCAKEVGENRGWDWIFSS